MIKSAPHRLLFFGVPFELDQPIHLHDIAPFAVIQVDDWFRIEPCQNFSSPNFSCPFPLQLQRVFSEPCIHLEELSGLLFQSNDYRFWLATKGSELHNFFDFRLV